MLDKRYADYEKLKVPENIKNVHKILNKANAFIIVSAEYNHMPPPALINIFNYYYSEFNRKPSCVCTYSSGDFSWSKSSESTKSNAFSTRLSSYKVWNVST